jgi:hypothetical protein
MLRICSAWKHFLAGAVQLHIHIPEEQIVKTSSAKIFVGPLILVGLALVSILSTVFADDNHNRGRFQANVNLWDYCDPTSFNATLGPDTCNRDTTTGAITVTGFLGELSSEKSVGAWRFSPAELKSDHRSITLTLKNVGGETHTFTKVKKFGGGFVDALNQASGNPTPAPECATLVGGVLNPQPASDDNLFIAPGATASAVTPRRDDQIRYQCCIHPWMRLVVGNDDDHDHNHHH